MAANLTVLDFTNADFTKFPINHAQLSIQGDALAVQGTTSNIIGEVTFPLPEKLRDLSAHHYLEIDVENTGAKALRFTFWALSGNGWAAISTWTTRKYELGPDKPKPLGYEVLAPGKRQKYKIDLYGHFPGPDAYPTAINPASVRWLRLIIGDGRSTPSALLRNVIATDEKPAETPPKFPRVFVPDVEHGQPAAGKRVYQQLPGWENTKVTHVLTLPKDWHPGGRYPVIVEFTGNIFFDKFCHSTGYTDQGNMAYGLSKGEKYICLNLPYISEDGLAEQFAGWGSPEKTVEYCLQAIRFVCEKYRGDSNEVFYTGFSRGMIGANYIALRDDRIAGAWLGFVGTNPGMEWTPAMGKGWNNSGIGWNERAVRLKGRSFIAAHPQYGFGVHVDVEYVEDNQTTLETRQWMAEVLKNRPSTTTVRGRVVDAQGQPTSGVRISTGATRFTDTAADGSYDLSGLCAGEWILTATKTGKKFQPAEIRISLDKKPQTARDFIQE